MSGQIGLLGASGLSAPKLHLSGRWGSPTLHRSDRTLTLLITP